ncbi:hypothetical protein F2Q69_00060038 [Brassica cretica]|uniref:Uncharacterized protein n=1 Tax=Brassica cretica TaxID=69181 RepID=A0A8S9RCA5_BRACR|nr:hypothetical protein F2Q69_00060038 [Brassica cretica]
MAGGELRNGIRKACALLIVIDGIEGWICIQRSCIKLIDLTDVVKMRNSRAAKTANTWSGFTFMLPLFSAHFTDLLGQILHHPSLFFSLFFEATVTFELLHDFCNGVRYGFIVLNPINSDARAVFFNVLLAFELQKLDGSLFRHEIGVSGTDAGSGEKEPERTKVKKLAVYGNLIFGGFDTAHALARRSESLTTTEGSKAKFKYEKIPNSHLINEAMQHFTSHPKRPPSIITTPFCSNYSEKKCKLLRYLQVTKRWSLSRQINLSKD